MLCVFGPCSMFARPFLCLLGHVLCLLGHVLCLPGHVLCFLSHFLCLLAMSYVCWVMFYVCWAMFYFVGPCSMCRNLRLRSNITDEIYVPKVYHHDYLEKLLIIQCSLLPVKTCMFFVTIYLYLMLLFV